MVLKTRFRQIAASLDRAPATIARELRNRSRQQGYRPRYAQEQAHARRWRGARLDRDTTLREQVLARLKQGWSPGQIGRDKRQAVISHERSTASSMPKPPARSKAIPGATSLPRAKWKRGRRRRRCSPAALIQHRRPLEERPASATDRQTPGHWEADLMLFRTGQAVLTGMNATPACCWRCAPQAKRPRRLPRPSLGCWARCLPPGARRSPSTTVPSSPAITRSTPWAWRPSSGHPRPLAERRGGKRHRAPAPRVAAQPTSAVSGTRFTELVQLYNNTPRKCLDYQTPAEVFWNDVLHFKCESTCPLSRE